MAQGGVQPIRPEDVVGEKANLFPDAVIESFNELIAQNALNGRACVMEYDVVKLMVKKGLKRNEIYDKHWLDVEDVYRAAGWEVEYDKPAYNESYPASFTFRRSRKRE